MSEIHKLRVFEDAGREIGGLMLAITGATRRYYVAGFTDMRYGKYALVNVVRYQLHRNPYNGDGYMFMLKDRQNSCLFKVKKKHTDIDRMEMTNNGHIHTVEFEFLERFDVMSYRGVDYLGDPRVKVVASDVHRIDVGNVYVLNKVHTKLVNSVSFVNDTAPEILDCTTELAIGEVLRGWL